MGPTEMDLWREEKQREKIFEDLGVRIRTCRKFLEKKLMEEPVISPQETKVGKKIW